MMEIQTTREAVQIQARAPHGDKVYRFWLSYGDWHDTQVIWKHNGYRHAFRYAQQRNKGPRKKWEKDFTSQGRQTELFK